jgi:hypothetical protein
MRTILTACVTACVCSVAYAQQASDVSVRLRAGFNYDTLFYPRPNGPPACGSLGARAHCLTTPIIAGAQVLYRDAIAAGQAAAAYRRCVEGHDATEAAVLGVLIGDLP